MCPRLTLLCGEMQPEQWFSAVAKAHQSLYNRSSIEYEDFERFCKGCEVFPVTLDGDTVGAVIVKGAEIHACIASGFKRWFRKEQAAILNAVIEKHGYAETTATTPEGAAFVKRLGFAPHGGKFRRVTKWELNQ